MRYSAFVMGRNSLMTRCLIDKHSLNWKIIQEKRLKKQMDKMRKKHIEEMERIRQAINNTESEYLKRDYLKALNQMQKDLLEYDMYRSQYSGRS